MTCEDARRLIPLIPYAETSFDEEEAVHEHLAVCDVCRAEFDAAKTLHGWLDERELELSPFFLRRSRDELAAAISAERAHHSWFAGLKSAFAGSNWFVGFGKPVAALALVALGFFGARLAPVAGVLGFKSAALLDPSNAHVRYVEPGPQGRVQLVVDETRQRVISGRVDDTHIQALLLAAAKDPSDPGLRVESVNILKNNTETDEIRAALIYALENDANPGVRFKALEGLKQYSSQPDVRKALSHVLLADDNPGLRTQAIDLLTQNSNEEHVVGVLQELLRKEGNGYIRLRCEKALRGMKASVDTY
jgi:HEAT repeats/Putative zinc-finger